MPPVSPLGMDSGMTGFAQGDQVVPIVSPAFCQRFLVVDLFHHHVPAVLQAQLAERMAGHVGIPDLLPRPAVPFLGTRTSFILFVPLGDDLLMLLTVPTVRQVRAARKRTGPLGFSRHSCHLLSGNKKALQISLQGFSLFPFLMSLSYHEGVIEF